MAKIETALKNLTPFRALSKDVQRDFGTRFPGLTGAKFNYYFDLAQTRGDDYAFSCIRSALGYRGMQGELATVRANEMVVLIGTAKKELAKHHEHREIAVEAAGLMSVEQLREKFWMLNISVWGKKHLSINLYGNINMEAKTHAEWTYKAWENVPYAQFYKPEDIQAAAERLSAKLVADAQKRLQEMITLATQIKENA